MFVNKFQEVNAWGWAYWLWNFRPHANPNFNLVSITGGESVEPTQNFEYIKNTISALGQSRSTLSSLSPSSMTTEANLDTIFPTVNITTVGIEKPGNTVLVTGQAFDVGTDIKEIKVRIDDGLFEAADPDSETGWLDWSASVPVEGTESCGLTESSCWKNIRDADCRD
jgi:hypothetical protein